MVELKCLYFTECKLACHKKCHPRLQIECNEGNTRLHESGNGDGIFGVSLRRLIPDNGTVPLIVDKLITVIEFYGLRQEGIYRKSGTFSNFKANKTF